MSGRSASRGAVAGHRLANLGTADAERREMRYDAKRRNDNEYISRGSAMSYMPLPSGMPPKPAVAPMPALAGPSRVEYMRAYNYVFENPNWMTNILWLGLAMLIAGMVPGVGVLVYIPLLGYGFEVVEALLANGGRGYPDVDMNRIERYFYRGLWPFLVGMIVSMVAMFVVLPLFYGAMIALVVAASAMGDSDAAGIMLVIGLPFLFLLMFAAMAAVGVLTMPFILRGGLSQDFAASFDFGWARDFLKRVGMDALFANLFLTITYMILLFLGLLVFCVGAYAAVAVAFLAWSHLMFQLYAVYLSRGGSPIPLKPEPPPPMMPPAPQYQ